MPVRKIPKSFRSVTGRFPSKINGRCVGYESKLEHDYYLKLEFDRTVASYEEQPLKVAGIVKGISVTYVPDCLVKYKDDKPPLLVEVKYQKEIEADDENLQLKLARMREYAEENAIHFQVITEQEVYGTAFRNYLLLYRRAKKPLKFDSKRQKIFAAFGSAREASLRQILAALDSRPIVQAEFTPVIWHLLYIGQLTTDLSVPISYDSIMRWSHG